MALRDAPRARRRGRRARLGRRRLRLAQGARSRSRTGLAGKGATSRVTGAYFADGDQHLDYDTLQEHQAPNTTSDFAFKGVLRDNATSVWRGMIKVEREAQRTNAYQENRNLLLSPQAHADSIPGLEILAQRRALHARRHGLAGEPRRALLLHGARALPRGGAAPDRARLLPGDLRPHRARPGARRRCRACSRRACSRRELLPASARLHQALLQAHRPQGREALPSQRPRRDGRGDGRLPVPARHRGGVSAGDRRRRRGRSSSSC